MRVHRAVLEDAKVEQISSEPPFSRAYWLAETLRARLLGGVYRPGQWIREATLRKEFAVSNGPVREALQVLIADKLLERIPYCGVRVVCLEPQDIVELFQLRSAMMELAAEIAAKKRLPDALAKIPEILEFLELNFEKKQPFLGVVTTWVAESSGSARLARAWHELFLQTQLYIPETRAHRANFERALQHIKAMIAAIAAGEPEVARIHARAFTRAQVEALGLDMTL